MATRMLAVTAVVQLLTALAVQGAVEVANKTGKKTKKKSRKFTILSCCLRN
jgi:hypothetical protein